MRFDELGGVGPDDLDLAERRGIENADRLAHRLAFARDRLMHVLAVAREIAGALPLPDVLERGALRRCPVVGRRRAHGVEQFAARRAGEGAEGDGRIGQAEGGEADCGQRLVERRGGDAERVHVRGLALVGRHAGRGVALDVLDRAEAFAHGELDILRGDVVLEIDEGLDARGRRARAAARRAAAAGCGAPRRRMRARRRRRSPRPRAAASPAASPSASVAARPKTPRARAGGALRCRPRPGRKACSFSSKRSLPRDCEKRWIVGVQPPDISTGRRRTVRTPAAVRGEAHGLDARPPRRRSCDQWPGVANVKAGAARPLRQEPDGSWRRSRIAAISTPAAASSSAAR